MKSTYPYKYIDYNMHYTHYLHFQSNMNNLHFQKSHQPYNYASSISHVHTYQHQASTQTKPDAPNHTWPSLTTANQQMTITPAKDKHK